MSCQKARGELLTQRAGNILRDVVRLNCRALRSLLRGPLVHNTTCAAAAPILLSHCQRALQPRTFTFLLQQGQQEVIVQSEYVHAGMHNAFSPRSACSGT